MRKLTRLAVWAIGTFLFFSQANAQQTAKMTSNGIGYLEYLPQGYKNNLNKYPIVISLHGIKEKGNTLADVQKVANVGLPKYVKAGQQYPFILISPQLKTSMGGWTGDYIMQVLNHVKKQLRIDDRRVYLTGLSLGGFGVWKVATAYPSVWAAILPICSGGNVLSGACKIAADDIPTWAFHGTADNIVSYQVSVKMVNAINACTPKPSPLAKITLYSGMNHIIWDKVYKESGALNWMLGYTNGSSSGTTTPENQAPVVNAGADVSKTLPTNSAVLNGSATDSDGTISSYSWSQVSGPNTAALANKTTKSLTVSSLVAGSYVFRLKATDNDGAYDTDDVKVTVNTATTSSAPVVSAGSDKTITLPTNNISLQGTASDPDGIASWQWTKLSGGGVSLSGTTSAKLTCANMVAGTYSFRLTVKDRKGNAKYDDVKVTVKSSGNIAPVANAGSDKSISGSSIRIYGSGTDADGAVRYYKWFRVSGPGNSVDGVSTKTLTVYNMKSGKHVFRLMVTDDKGATDTDEVTINVTNGVAMITDFDDSELIAEAR